MTPIELEDLREQLLALKEARRSGAKRIVFGDRDVTYKSDDEMRQAQRELEAEISGEENVIAGRRRRRPRSIITVFRRG